MRFILAAGAAALALKAATAFAQSPDAGPSPASDVTKAANDAFSETLPWEDTEDEALSDRGFIATREDPLIRNAAGETVFDLSAYDFASGEAPDTANPSLWRHLKMMRKHGLYEVAPKIYQVRGFDVTVMSILETDTGYVVVDPMLTKEPAAAAMELVYEQLGDKPVRALIYTHSHGDHYLGAKGVVSAEAVAAGETEVIAPEGFMEHTISENLIAGPAMSRRAVYQFGSQLEPGPAGHAGVGIGTRLSSGTMTLIPPTRTISETGERITVDGLEFEFQMTPGAEAPAEMNFYLPQLNALCLAENGNATMHNVLPARGALVRDAKAWADYLTESRRLYGDEAEVVFTSHGWPRWGNEAVNTYISHHRDAYKYLHDQTVRLMNKGYTPQEIADEIALPDSLSAKWYNHGYYGTMAHNAKAVYQRYLGWYDANPVNLDPLAPEEAGERYVKAMGGPAAALEIARQAYEAGDYRWSSEVASRIVFADASDMAARTVLADSLEQLGYQSEGTVWRNIYLTGAREARETPDTPSLNTVVPEVVAVIDTPSLFDLLAIRVDPAAADGKSARVAFVFPERDERVLVRLENSVLVHELNVEDEVQATVTLPRRAFLAMLFQGQRPAALMADGTLTVEGDAGAMQTLMSSFETPQPDALPFPIVTP